MILYFSGTGNSEYVARKISAEINDCVLSLSASLTAKTMMRIPKNQVIIFVTPTYAWRIPRVVENWIRKNDSIQGQKVYFLMTCGSEIGNADQYLRALCDEKKLEYMGVQQIRMPENYIAMFETPGKEEAEKIVREAEPSIMQAAECIMELKKIQDHPKKLSDKVKSGMVNNLFYPMFVKADPFYAKDNCIGCEKCQKVCPLQNITFKGGKPVWGKNCTHCMACISSCPVKAIEYGSKSVGKERYRCPF